MRPSKKFSVKNGKLVHTQRQELNANNYVPKEYETPSRVKWIAYATIAFLVAVWGTIIYSLITSK